MMIKVIDKELAWQLRHKVMWPNKPFDFIKIEEDDEGTHYGLYEGEELVSVLSLFVQGEQAHFRKFATLTNYQKRGFGSQLLNHVLDEATSTGIKRIYCNARVNKASYYEKFGFSKLGDTFNKSGKDYILMERYLLK
ncbi:GNAT family N-acetyltransferase [Paenibacillus glycanilyticus]|nr:GNAT family N-acetyltransferase [Paenibacillus glycanilyticus]